MLLFTAVIFAGCSKDDNPTISVEKVVLNKTTLPMTVGDIETLTTTISPDGVVNKTVTWTSSHPDVAEVDDKGMVTAKSEGTAIITATSVDDATKFDECSVSVTSKLIWKNIGKGKWTSQLFGGTHEVDFEESIETPGTLYRVLNLISDGFSIEINISKEQGTAWVEFQDTGYDDDGDRLYYNALGTYKDGVITFLKADANHPNYYCTKSETGYSPAYYLVESFEMPEGY